MVEDGLDRRHQQTNAYISRATGSSTRHLSHDILHGITRAAVLVLPARHRWTVEERRLHDLQRRKEAGSEALHHLRPLLFRLMPGSRLTREAA